MVLHVNIVLGTEMKTNVTLKLDADLLREARGGCRRGTSVSALLTDRLEAIVRERKAFDKARRRALARLREGLDLQWRPPSSRDELHERSSNFVDTNILMYAHDKAAGAKHDRAKALVEELWRDRTGVISTQVLQELAVNLRRKAAKPLDATATRDVVADYLTWQVVVNGGDSILEALELETRYQISFWDSCRSGRPVRRNASAVSEVSPMANSTGQCG